MIALVLAALLAPLAGGDNRRWNVALELTGPLDEVRLDCGADGGTRLVGPLLAGERRTVEVPVPVRSPLGAAALSRLPLPEVEVVPAGAGRCRSVRWVEPRAEEELERGARGLLSRPRPPAPASASVRPGAPELLLAGSGLVLLVGLRRRVATQCGVGLGLAVALGFLAARGPGPASGRQLLDVDLETGRAVRVTSTRGEIELREHVEVRPEGAALAFEVSLRTGMALGRAPGRSLFAIEAAPMPALGPEGNDWLALARVWTRSPAGEWAFHGPWARGIPLPPSGPSGTGARETPGPPPGWLVGALPPGRRLLVAEVGAEHWLRLVGEASAPVGTRSSGSGPERSESVPGGD